MVPLQLIERGPVAQHHPLGASTGYMEARRGDWASLVAEAMETSTFAIELAALSEDELPGLQDFLATAPALPFRYLSVHAPVKHRRTSEEEMVARLADLPPWVDAIVVHPDVMDEPARYRALGATLIVENMDPRKATGRTVAELEPIFAELPEAGFCFDIAHAAAIDPTMDEAHRLLDRFCGRLRHLHVSSLDDECHHEPLADSDELAWTPVLRRCRDVPWILEAPLDV
jgi:sugar phosphate isomerase/epimerase